MVLALRVYLFLCAKPLVSVYRVLLSLDLATVVIRIVKFVLCTTGHHCLHELCSNEKNYSDSKVSRDAFIGKQAKQGGKVGIIADAQWYVPYSNSPADIEAVERMQAFQVRWY